eukprot:CAMPEP_0201534272 /NCGR_PEP_ID=MMETSP0161_2-20130828/55798_1 /ASSEMBLY_ACC=CAM_ASM_000251 /TAXON_ID=180227 /ORGANISM="Neoparamoeba aestuarina, Strain SoJaBio B1-5/56/2" /LENGTH=188 /DNA_ID=CAMNT_0047938813 /DNA_START=160 /DNA_END=722 /DNA_ORIENTATION=-
MASLALATDPELKKFCSLSPDTACLFVFVYGKCTKSEFESLTTPSSTLVDRSNSATNEERDKTKELLQERFPDFKPRFSGDWHALIYKVKCAAKNQLKSEQDIVSSLSDQFPFDVVPGVYHADDVLQKMSSSGNTSLCTITLLENEVKDWISQFEQRAAVLLKILEHTRGIVEALVEETSIPQETPYV